MKYVFYLAVLFGVISSVAGACTFPSRLQGNWESPSKGNITIASTEMTGYEVDTYTNLTFYCHNKSSSQYVLRSDNFTVLAAGNEAFALICLKFTRQSSNVYTYFVLTSQLPDANNERVVFWDATNSFTTNDACDNTSVQSIPQETKLLVRYGTASSEAIQCPDDILGQYWYSNGTTCNSSFWDVCTDLTQMTFDYSMCDTQLAFSGNGVVNCMYYVSDGTQLVTYVYNTDATVNSAVNSTYQYTCMVLELSNDGQVYVTMHPEECEANQTAYYVVSPGIDITLSPNIPSTSTTSTTTTTTATTTVAVTEAPAEVSNAGLIAGVVVVVILLIVAGGVVAGYCIWKKKKVTPTPNANSTAKQSRDKNPAMLQEIDGRETITPSAMSTHIQSRNGSHGKLKQVFGREFTMTDETKLAQANTSNETVDTDTNKLKMNVTDLEGADGEASPRKLPPIEPPSEKPTSPLDTHLQSPLPPISMN